MSVYGHEAEVQIKQLSRSDASLYREVRLQALELAAEAFSSTFGAENDEPLSWFADRLEKSTVFGAFSGQELLGIAAFVPRPGRREQHKGVLVGMYVRQQARERGLGRRLAQAVINYARGRVEILQLSVIAGNETARSLYASLGFVEYGLEQNALKENGRYWDDVLMAKSLLPENGTGRS